MSVDDSEGKLAPAPRRKPMKNAALREESIHKLSEAAFRLFVTKGYAATTLQQIADTVGMTKGAIFFYFQSKENLLFHLLQLAEQNIVVAFETQCKTAEGNALDRIVAFFHHGARQGLERPYELLCLIQISIEFGGQDNEIGKRVSAIYQRNYDLLTQVVVDGQERGELESSIRPTEFVSMIVAMHDGMMLEWHRRGGEIDGRRLVQAVRLAVLHGISSGATKRD
jgi:AcrR family transcriptional regulator